MTTIEQATQRIIVYSPKDEVVVLGNGARGPQGPVGPQGPPGDTGPLGNLSDVNVGSAIDNNVLAYDSATETWGPADQIAAGSLRLSVETDLSTTSTGHAFQIGDDPGANMVMDTNEIMARNNGQTAQLYLNNDGGPVFANGYEITPTTWSSPTLVSTWSNYGGAYQACQYRKIGDLVYIRGLIKVIEQFAITPSTYWPIFTLPSGHRPPYEIILSTIAASSAASPDNIPCEIRIKGDGTVNYYVDAGAPNLNGPSDWLTVSLPPFSITT